MPARVPKRQKLSSEAASSDEDDYLAFARLARDRSIIINGVHAARIPGAGLGLRTTRDIKKGEQLVFVPESAMFKPDTKFLKRNALDRNVSPQAALAISALACAEDSPNTFYQAWMATWPTDEDFVASMPMCWPVSLQEQLPPTVQQHLHRQQADYTRDWQAVEKLCGRREWPETRFRYFWMIINSRSFHWKPASQRRSHGGGSKPVSLAARAGAMVMCPYLDFMNHAPTGATIEVFQRSNGYEVLANRTYAAGEEIFATYGAHSNDRLLVHYGFVLDDALTADDDVPLDHALLPHWTDTQRTQLQDVGFLGNYALVRATNQLCFRTQVAVRCAMQTCNEWEYFLSNGEDLGIDRSDDVRRFAAKLLRPWLERARERWKDVSSQLELVGKDGEASMPLQLIGARWRQIVRTSETYLAD